MTPSNRPAESRRPPLAVCLGRLAPRIVLAAIALSPGIAHAGAGVWTTGGPWGGRVADLAINPADSRVVYAAAASGVLKSTDSGDSWAPANLGLASAVSALAIDPSSPSTIYAGGAGVFKSTDSGGSWVLVTDSVEGGSVRCLAIDPVSPSTLYAGTDNSGPTGGAVFRSTDSGRSWLRASHGIASTASLTALAVDPSNPANLLASGHIRQLYRSTDSGGTWSPRSSVSSSTIVAFAVHPAAPGTVYAAASTVVKSTDFGLTWTESDTGLPWYGSALAVTIDPVSPGIIYASLRGKGIFRSTDAGATWTSIGADTATEIDRIVVDPRAPERIYAAAWNSSVHHGGVLRSRDAGATWTLSTSGIAGVTVRALAVAPSSPGTIYAGADGLVAPVSTDSGVSWTTREPTYSYVRAIAVDSGSATTLHAAVYGLGGTPGLDYSHLEKSTDGGATWQRSGLEGKNISALAADPRRPGTLFAGGGGIFKSTDGGASWAGPGPGATALAISPSDPDTIYAAADGGVSRSTDSGATWITLKAGLPGYPLVRALAIDPATSATVYVGVWRVGLYKSTDSGASWTASGTGLPLADALEITSIVTDPANPGTVYAGTQGQGVFRSTNFGRAWVPVNGGLRNLSVSALALDPSGPTTLYAAFDRGSVWQVNSPPASTAGSSVLPVVLDVDTGRMRYTTEVILTNDGEAQDVALTYTPSLGTRSGGGTVSVTIPAGQQVVYADVLAALRTLGLAIPAASPSAPQGGTLLVAYDSSRGLVHATARTTSPISSPHPEGRVGVAYPATSPSEAIRSRAMVFGLRSTSADRSNLAVFNPGIEPVTVRVTLVSGSGDGKRAIVADGLVLPPLGWTQIDDPLAGVGMTNAWGLVERTSSSGAFAAYGVVNDNSTNDGSYIPAVPEAAIGPTLTIPVLVETAEYQSELLLANKGKTTVTLRLRYVESLSPSLGAGGARMVILAPGEQRIIPSAIDYLRAAGGAIGAKGAGAYAGLLRVEVTAGWPVDVFAAARTSAASPAGGRFGVFIPALYSGQNAWGVVSIYGLRSDAMTRSNVAIANVADCEFCELTLELAVHDGSDAGRVRRTLTLPVAPGQWIQPYRFLADSGVANGYVTITRTWGNAPWLAYGVVDDGGSPGQRTGDGAYVPMVE